MASRLLGVREAAEILNVNTETLRRWDNSGKLKAIKIGTGKHRRYKRTDIDKLIQKREIATKKPE